MYNKRIITQNTEILQGILIWIGHYLKNQIEIIPRTQRVQEDRSKDIPIF